MKKVWIFGLVFVMILSSAVTFFACSLFRRTPQRIYSNTSNLTALITNEEDMTSLAKKYRDGHATMAVYVEGYNSHSKKSYSSLGSGVCVASKGYQTSLSSEYVASKGSYIVTNYHVISYCNMQEFTQVSISVIPENENMYDAKLLWSNKNLDLALLYCEENFDYVAMKDRVVYCSDSEKLDYEPIFTIGTPLELNYLNRFTTGYVASNNALVMATTDDIYLNGDSFNYFGTSYQVVSTTVLSNLYEDVIDVSVSISPGNSGGGCFDKHGYLIGLTTLGKSVEETNGNQMNGVVPIYPIMKILDKLIDKNENKHDQKIYTLDALNLIGFDRHEAGLVAQTNVNGKYFFNEKFYSVNQYKNDFAFEDEGFYVLNDQNQFNLKRGSVIKSITINNNYTYKISDRNDLIFALLQANEGDNIRVA